MTLQQAIPLTRGARLDGGRLVLLDSAGKPLVTVSVGDEATESDPSLAQFDPSISNRVDPGGLAQLRRAVAKSHRTGGGLQKAILSELGRKR